MKSIYEMLKPELKTSLQESARKYSSAKRLKYTLMSKVLWQELTISEVSEVITYTNLSSYDISPSGFLYGSNLLNNS